MNATHTLSPETRPTESGTPDTRTPDTRTPASGTPESRTPSTRTATALRDADGMAVASFVLGLTGLLLFNLILGPCALVLGGLALVRGTARRGRAALGMALGAADLVVLGTVIATNHAMSWSLTG